MQWLSSATRMKRKNSGNKITAIENIVLTDPENRPFVKSKLLKAIIRKGTPEGVDTVTGATCSSKAILEACREALQQAKK